MIQLSELLHAVAHLIDGQRDIQDIATDLGRELQRPVTPADVNFLITRKLGPAGVTMSPDGIVLLPARPPEAFGLKLKARVIPPSLVYTATTVATPLFAPLVMIAVVGAAAGFDAWLLLDHGLAQAARLVLLRPELTLAILGLTLASTAFHELGHATACRYGGAKPGTIGVGLYIAWPVFYSDVTDSYRLGRWARLRTDIGGVYFNVVLAMAVALVYHFWPFEPLLLVIALVQVDALHQFFPFFRLDGYYIASDLIGVPDLFMRMRPTLASLIPGRRIPPQVAALKAWARYAVGVWVVLTLLIVAVLYALLVLATPRLLATARQSFDLHATVIKLGVEQHAWPVAALATGEMVLLLLPLFAVALTTLLMVRRLLRSWLRFTRRQPAFRVATGLAAALAVMVGGAVLASPSGYEPITRTERGTIPPPWTAVREADPLNNGPYVPPLFSPMPSSTPSLQPSAPAGGTGSSTPAPAVNPSPSPSPSAPSQSPSPSPAGSPSPSPT